MEHLREEFKTGMDTLTKYILERARPKQLGSIVLTGPMLASLAQSFLDAINSGGVPTIATSWQVGDHIYNSFQLSIFFCARKDFINWMHLWSLRILVYVLLLALADTL